jgi:hypothetical protein
METNIKINMEKDLINLHHDVRILAYYFGFWYQNNTDSTLYEKQKLLQIYKQLIETKPSLEEIVLNETFYDNIIESLEKYKADEGDSMGQLQLYDIKSRLLEKFTNTFL